MVDFAKMKKMSGRNSLEQLAGELTKFNTNQTESKKDDRFWYPAVDKAGNGYSVIRFLPAPGEEDLPFVRMFEHGFKGPTGSWYIENSLTTIGQKDPVGEYNTQLWNSGLDSDKEIARKQKRKLSYVSNVYVITDQLNPENEGKVFLFKYGKKIWDKLNDVMNPQYADEAAINPFDLWAGANFKLKIRNVEGYRNYDKSEFAAAAPLSTDDEEMEAIWKKTNSLKAFLAPSNFKSYDELKAKLNKVLGIDGSTVGKTPAAARATASTAVIEEIERAEAPKLKATPSKYDEDEEDLDMEFFNSLSK
jgi:hypothetical protein